MKRILTLLPAAAILAAAAAAQDIRYRAEISAADRVNSRGVPLRTLGEFLRQDRYNFHGGHHVDPGDTHDERFHTVAARSLIDGARLVAPPGLEAAVVAGTIATLEVTVSGSGESLVLHVAPAGGDAPLLPALPGMATAGGEPNRIVPGPPDGFRVAYTTTLGPRDWTDSNGAPWFRLRDVLKQDRANVNRFGIADAGDERDDFFHSAAERKRFDQTPMRLDTALAGPLSRRETVKVRVLLQVDDVLFVSRPGDGVGAGFETAEDLLDEQRRKVEALAASHDPGTVSAARGLVQMADIVHGRDHEESAIARVLLASMLLRENRAEEARPLVAEIERDFRAAAGREVSPDAIVTVMGFLVRAHRALGDVGAAAALLRELLESPGRERWGLDDARRARLEEAIGEDRADGRAGPERPRHEEAGPEPTFFPCPFPRVALC